MSRLTLSCIAMWGADAVYAAAHFLSPIDVFSAPLQRLMLMATAVLTLAWILKSSSADYHVGYLQGRTDEREFTRERDLERN